MIYVEKVALQQKNPCMGNSYASSGALEGTWFEHLATTLVAIPAKYIDV